MTELHERIRMVVEGFESYVKAVPSDWWPGSRHAIAMERRWNARSARRAFDDEEFVATTFAALRGTWRAFRPANVPIERFEEGVQRARGLLEPLEEVTITDLDLDRHGSALHRLFISVGNIKPTARKWMACSKILYHLLPDLVPPMDNKFTARFLGRSSLPTGLEYRFLEESFGVFSRIADSVGDRRLEAAAVNPNFTPKLGLARTIDFAVTGYSLRSGLSLLRVV